MQSEMKGAQDNSSKNLAMTFIIKNSDIYRLSALASAYAALSIIEESEPFYGWRLLAESNNSNWFVKKLKEDGYSPRIDVIS